MLKSIPQKQMKSIATMIKNYISNVKTKRTYVRSCIPENWSSYNIISIDNTDNVLLNKPCTH